MRPALTALLLLAACGADPLVLRPTPVPIGYDHEDVHGLVPLDLDRDGDTDFVAAVDSGLRYLAFDAGRWSDATPGTALERAGVARALASDGEDLLLERPDGSLARLRHSGIGSWQEGGTPPAALPPAPLAVEADLDGDGRPDRAELDGTRLRVLLAGPDGALRDASAALGVGALPLRGAGRALFARDLDGDGRMDLLAHGTRVMAWFGNGGVAPPP